MLDEAAPGALSSFLYCGCYQLREGLTIAQRAAWGLHGAGLVQLSKPSARAQTLLGVSANPAPLFNHPAKSGRFAPAGARSVLERHKRSKLVTIRRSPRLCKILADAKTARPSYPAKSCKGRWPYRKLELVVDGTPVTCVLFRGRAFLHSCGRPQ